MFCIYIKVMSFKYHFRQNFHNAFTQYVYIHNAFKKYKEIWDKIRNFFSKTFDSEPVYNDK